MGAEIQRHADNLKVEGEFTGKSTELKAHKHGERARVVRHNDNLKMEGSMAQRSKSTVGVGQRAATVRHEDNLRLEGKMEGRQVGTAAAKGERFGVIRREDNLKVEGGKFEGRPQSSAAHTSSQQQNGTTGMRARSNTGSTIVLGDENAGTIKRTTKTTSSATSKTAASTSMKATESNLVLAGGVASAGDGSISAVNRDAFAASLRESTGVAVGAQKEMSVIEHHRKQSLQRAQQQEQRASTAYSISASNYRDDHHSGGAIGAHTGRTSAYGGRDYEYSANLASTSSRRQSSVQQSSSTSYSISHQQSGQHSWQQATGNFNARQVAGYSASSSRQTGAALIQQSPLSSNAASNLYQSTTSGSYKVHQLDATRDVRGSSTGRRKTWAESSILHGATAGIGQSLYAQYFQQHSCPASKVYTESSPFKYERQSSSGHKLFRQQERGA